MCPQYARGPASSDDPDKNALGRWLAQEDHRLSKEIRMLAPPSEATSNLEAIDLEAGQFRESSEQEIRRDQQLSLVSAVQAIAHDVDALPPWPQPSESRRERLKHVV
jgi:hypothetical protein